MSYFLLLVLSTGSASVFAHEGPFYSLEHIDAILFLVFAAAAVIAAGLIATKKPRAALRAQDLPKDQKSSQY